MRRRRSTGSPGASRGGWRGARRRVCDVEIEQVGASLRCLIGAHEPSQIETPADVRRFPAGEGRARRAHLPPACRRPRTRPHLNRAGAPSAPMRRRPAAGSPAIGVASAEDRLDVDASTGRLHARSRPGDHIGNRGRSVLWTTIAQVLLKRLAGPHGARRQLIADGPGTSRIVIDTVIAIRELAALLRMCGMLPTAQRQPLPSSPRSSSASGATM